MLSQDQSDFLAEPVPQCDTSLAGDEVWTVSFLTFFPTELLSPSPSSFSYLILRATKMCYTETLQYLLPNELNFKNMYYFKKGVVSCWMPQRYFYTNK